MKKIVICLTLALMLVLGGCTQINQLPSSETANSGSEDISPATEITIPNMEKNSVVNLPSQLYQADQSAYAKFLRHDFKVEEKTELTITAEVTSGNLSLGIEDKDSQKYVFDMKDFQSETDSITLEKGRYTIVIEKSEFTGRYYIKGTPIE